MNTQKFLICEICGNIIGKIYDSGVPMMCCGQQMNELAANTVDAAIEKHLPVIVLKGDTVEIDVGSVAHPMLEEHHIVWIYVETKAGGQRKGLMPGDAPKACFKLCDDELIAAYAYCNIHGLWMTEV